MGNYMIPRFCKSEHLPESFSSTWRGCCLFACVLQAKGGKILDWSGKTCFHTVSESPTHEKLHLYIILLVPISGSACQSCGNQSCVTSQRAATPPEALWLFLQGRWRDQQSVSRGKLFKAHTSISFLSQKLESGGWFYHLEFLSPSKRQKKQRLQQRLKANKFAKGCKHRANSVLPGRVLDNYLSEGQAPLKSGQNESSTKLMTQDLSRQCPTTRWPKKKRRGKKKCSLRWTCILYI